MTDSPATCPAATGSPSLPRPFGLLIRTLLLLLLAGPVAEELHAQVSPRPFLFKDARGELAAARAQGDSTVLVIIASREGENPQVADVVESMGGTIGFREDGVDYLRARVPVQEVDGLAAHPGVHSLEISIVRTPRALMRAGAPTGDAEPGLDGLIPSWAAPPAPASSSPRVGAPSAGHRPPAPADTVRPTWPPQLTDYPLRYRYSPLEDIGAHAFRASNPTFDGRGVVLALIDGHPDPLVPELQEALTLEGEPTSKFPIWETVVDPEEEDDGRWIEMEEVAEAVDGHLTFRDSVYTTPYDGEFRLGMLDEAQFDSLHNENLDQDLNRDGNPEGSSRLFAILWDEATGEVRVDTRQTLDFTDEEPLADYRERPTFGVFGENDPDTEVRESIAFAIQVDPENRRIAINAGVARHGALVIGAAVASRGPDGEGRFEGVAPGAAVASYAQGASAYGQTEAVIRAMQHPDVDIVFLEQHSTITRSYLLRDGRLVPTVIYERLIERYGKPLLVPTHNYPILGGTDDFVMARGAIGVGGHESRENYLTNHGVRVEHQDNLLITGGYGPMGDGSLTPDVISPSNHLSTARGFDEGRRMDGVYQLPPGYTIAGGTSTATPTAAAAVALLISAARQEGVAYDAFRLKHALSASARWVPQLPAYKQGNGVVNVAAAWEILRSLDSRGEELLTIESRGPVRHPYSHLLPTPHEGVSLFERDGWEAGDRGERTITFRRTSGQREPMTFQVTWAGNDEGTFTGPSSVTLPLGEEVAVPLQVAPREAGAHTAHLTLEHPDVPGFAHRSLLTVVAHSPLTEDDGFGVEVETEIPRPEMRSFFFRVPEGATALRVDLDAPEREVALGIFRPDTRSARIERTGSEGTGRSTHVVLKPMPGVWEVRLSDTRDTREYDWERAADPDPVPPTPATLTVSALGVELVSSEADPGVAGSDGESEAPHPPGEGTSRLALANRMATLELGAEGFPLGSARRAAPVIHELEQHVHEIEVPDGSKALLVRASGFADGADLDLYLFDCTGEAGDEDENGNGCSPALVDADPVGDQWILVPDPAPGPWKVVVDAPRVPEGEVSYDYLDVVFNPAFGHVAVTDIPMERESDHEWETRAHVWIAEPFAEAEGREPFPAILVRGLGAGDESFVLTVKGLRP